MSRERMGELLEMIKHHHAILADAERELFELYEAKPKVIELKAKPVIAEETKRLAPPKPAVPQGVVSAVLELLNEQASRDFSALEIIEELSIVATKDVVTAALVQLHAEFFVKRTRKGRYQAITNPEPKMGPED